MDDLKKVNIFLIGSRKSGTTSLANYLDSHKEISLSSIKESNFWDDRAIQRTDPIVAYHELFDWSVENQLDASTGYTSYPFCSEDVAEKIYNYNSQARLIYLVRHPIDRIISHYKMSYERGDLKGSLDDAIINHPLLIACGKYYFQLQRYLNFFSKEQLLVLNMDELNTKHLQNKLINFLNLDRDFDAKMTKDNSADVDFRMPRAAEGMLNSPAFSRLKKLFPKNFVHYIKGKIFDSLNKGMDASISIESIQLLKKELYDDIDELSAFVDFDIEKWKNVEDYQ